MNIEEYLKRQPQFKQTVVGYLIRDNRIILGRRIRVSHNLGENLIAGVGGKLESGETYDEAFIREFIEEFGTYEEGNIVCRPLKFKAVGNIKYLNVNDKWDIQMEVYICTEWEGEPVKTESMQPVGPYAFEDIPYDEMWEDNQLFLPKILEGKRVEGTVLYEGGKVKES